MDNTVDFSDLEAELEDDQEPNTEVIPPSLGLFEVNDYANIGIIREVFSWDHPNIAILFANLGVYCMSVPEIALIIGETEESVKKHMEEIPGVLDAYKAGPVLANAQVIRGLYHNATARGNVSAQQFWLKNRMADMFGPKMTIKGDKDNPLMFTVAHVLKLIDGKTASLPKFDDKTIELVKDEHGTYS